MEAFVALVREQVVCIKRRPRRPVLAGYASIAALNNAPFPIARTGFVAFQGGLAGCACTLGRPPRWTRIAEWVLET
jgi:hypothetical protein